MFIFAHSCSVKDYLVKIYNNFIIICCCTSEMSAPSRSCKLPGILSHHSEKNNNDFKMEIEEEIIKQKAISDALEDFGLCDKHDELTDKCASMTRFLSPLLLTAFAIVILLLSLSGIAFEGNKYS